MPPKIAQDENPYLTAFWKWWPELYKNLEVFRMTGGEPLLIPNTFKVLDYVYKNPKCLVRNECHIKHVSCQTKTYGHVY